MVTKKFFNYFFIYYEFSKIISLSLQCHQSQWLMIDILERRCADVLSAACRISQIRNRSQDKAVASRSRDLIYIVVLLNTY